MICWLGTTLNFWDLEILKKLKLPPRFVDFKQTIIPAGACFNEWQIIFCNEQLLQRVTREVLPQATPATSNKWILQQVTGNFLQQATSGTSNKRISQWGTSEFLQRRTSLTSNERILQQVTSDFLQRATSATSNEQI